MQNPLIALAIETASRAHANQKDKAGMPYIDHPVRVAEQLVEDDLKIIAYLHDVVEDTDITLAELAEKFGADIAEDIEALTKRKNEPYADFIQRLAPRPRARKVKMADLRDNLNLSRLTVVEAEDLERVEKYKSALALLELIEELDQDSEQ